MSEPTRMRDDANAPAEARRLLRPALSTRPVPQAVRERSAARLDRALIVPAAAGLIVWLKGVALATGVVVLFVAVPLLIPGRSPTPARATTGSGTTRPAPRASPLASSTANSPDALAVAPESSPRPLRGTSAAPQSTAPQRVEGDSLAREAAMLEQARAVLDNNPALALDRLEVHRMDFPSGELAMERELLAIDALSRLSRNAEARARGTTLLRAAPGSIYEARVRTIVDRLPKP